MAIEELIVGLLDEILGRVFDDWGQETDEESLLLNTWSSVGDDRDFDGFDSIKVNEEFNKTKGIFEDDAVENFEGGIVETENVTLNINEEQDKNMEISETDGTDISFSMIIPTILSSTVETENSTLNINENQDKTLKISEADGKDSSFSTELSYEVEASLEASTYAKKETENSDQNEVNGSSNVSQSESLIKDDPENILFESTTSKSTLSNLSFGAAIENAIETLENDEKDQVIPGYEDDNETNEMSDFEVPQFAEEGKDDDELEFYGKESTDKLKESTISDIKRKFVSEEENVPQINEEIQDYGKEVTNELRVHSHQVSTNSHLKRKIVHEKEDAPVYHSLCGVMMPNFLNRPPRLGLRKNSNLKSLHAKKPRIEN